MSISNVSTRPIEHAIDIMAQDQLNVQCGKECCKDKFLLGCTNYRGVLVVNFALTSCWCHTVMCFRMDASDVIKVADFGLSEDIYTNTYYRQSKSDDTTVKLPVRWMPPESIADGIFTEKSDVVSATNLT